MGAISFGATTLLGDSTDHFFLAKYNPTLYIPENTSESTLLTLYPNPTTGKISLNCIKQTDICTLEVYDCIGREVYHIDFNQMQLSNNALELQLPLLPSGVYLHRAVGKNFTEQIFFMIKSKL